ncbi:zinc finger, CCHC-type containing protein [Tanacetum coccineum]
MELLKSSRQGWLFKALNKRQEYTTLILMPLRGLYRYLKMLIAMASIHNLIIHQMDVKRAFLNGDLEEKAPKQWHQKFDEVVLSNGYLLKQADKCVYSKFDESGKGAISQSTHIEKVLKDSISLICATMSTPEVLLKL